MNHKTSCRCGACLFKNPHLFSDETLKEAGRFVFRLMDERAGGITKKLQNRIKVSGIKGLSSTQLEEFNERLSRYFGKAKSLGKDLSTHQKRIPYILNALRWTLNPYTPLHQKKIRSGIARRRWYFFIRRKKFEHSMKNVMNPVSDIPKIPVVRSKQTL